MKKPLLEMIFVTKSNALWCFAIFGFLVGPLLALFLMLDSASPPTRGLPLSCEETPGTLSENCLTREDLAAQRRMADASESLLVLTADQTRESRVGNVVGIIAAFASVAAAVGALVAARAAQQSVETAREAAGRELRPWLTMEASISQPVQMEKGQNASGLRIYLDLKVKNVGNGIARDVQMRCEANNLMLLDERAFYAGHQKKSIEQAAEREGTGELLAPTERTTMSHGVFVLETDLKRTLEGLDNSVIPVISAIVTYRDLKGAEIFYTAKTYIVADVRSGYTKAVLLDELPIPNGGANALPYMVGSAAL